MNENDAIKKLTTRVTYLEEIGQSTLDIMDLMVTVCDRLRKSPLDIAPNDIFENANLLINRFLPLKGSACYIVNEMNYAFELHLCTPKTKRSLFQNEIKKHIADGTYAWATRQKRPVIVPARGSSGEKIIFQSLRGESQVTGMFVGIFSGKEPVEGGLFLDLFSIIIYHLSQSLENVKLYKAQKNSERKYRELADMLPQTVFEIDRRGKMLFINQQGMDTFGLIKEEIMRGFNLSNLFIPEDKRKVRQALQEGWVHPENMGIEYTAKRHDKTQFPVLMYISPILIDTKHIGYRGIILDITERKKAETALYEREAMARALLNAPKDVAILVNLDGSIINMNKAAVDSLNVHTDDFTGLNILELLPRKIAQSRNKQAKSVLKTGQPVQFMDEMNQRIIDNIYYPIFNDKGNVHQLAIFARDITDTVKAEEERRILEHKLMEQTRMASIGLLTSGVAHNLRGPLAAMIGQIALCKMDYPDIEEWKILHTLCTNMTHIIDTMMAKTRREQEADYTPIDLNELLKTELSFLEAHIHFKLNIRKKYQFEKDLPIIIGKYSDFSQALMNIVHNAIDAMDDSKEKRLTVITQSDNQNVFIKIADTGYGISKENMSKLFTPFFSTKTSKSSDKSKKPQGTGLGLYSTYTILKRYGAHIDVQSKINEGTVFTINIPIQGNQN